MALTLKEECPLANLSKFKVVMIGGPQGDGTKLVMFSIHLQTSRSSRVTQFIIVSRWVMSLLALNIKLSQRETKLASLVPL